jgi:hypothetical protein
MDTTLKNRVQEKHHSNYIFMQNKTFLDDIVNVAEVSLTLIIAVMH